MAILSAVNASFAISYDTELLIPSIETQNTLSTPIHTATQNREIQKNYVDDWFGKDFTYSGPDENGLWYPDSGTVSGFTVSTKVGDVLVSLSGLSVSVASLNSISPPTSPTAPGEDVQLNAILFAGDDELHGSRFDDKLAGFGGNDLIDGGSGVDTASFFGASANYAITKTATGFTVTDKTGVDGTDTLLNVERLQFSDTTVGLDAEGIGGEAYRIYKAAFNRTPDKVGLGYWISQMDNGLSLNDVAGHFIESAEFQNMYGTNPTAEAFLSNVYTNVLGRSYDQAGYNWWLNEMKTVPTVTMTYVLAQFSESAENKAALAAVIGSGFSYDHWNG